MARTARSAASARSSSSERSAHRAQGVVFNYLKYPEGSFARGDGVTFRNPSVELMGKLWTRESTWFPSFSGTSSHAFPESLP